VTTESPLEHMHDARLAGLGHRPQLNLVPGGFSNFSVGYATALAHSAYFNLDWIMLVVMAPGETCSDVRLGPVSSTSVRRR